MKPEGNRIMRMISSATLAIILGAVLSGRVLAEEASIKMKMATIGPSTHIFNTEGAEYFMKRVSEESSGKIEFEFYPAEQLGKAKDYIDLTSSGLADISQIIPSYYTNKMPLSSVPGLPGLAGEACAGTKAVWSIIDGNAQIAKELAENGLVPLVSWVMVPYQLSTTKAPLESVVGELDGLKIRATAGVLDLVLKELGAIPISLAAPEIRDALDRGTIDGAFGTFTTNLTYQVAELLDYQTVGAPFGAYSAMFAISTKRFAAMSEENQNILKKVGRETSMHLCARLDEVETEAMLKNEEAGVKLVRLSPEQKSRISDALKSVENNWILSLKDRNIDAESVLKDFKEALSAN